MSPYRRAFVAGIGITLGSFAGCSQPGDSGGESGQPAGQSGETTTEATEDTTVTDEDATKTGTSEIATGTPALDLREANVVEVTVESAGNGEYRFDVTLYHDDDGEEGYADWWQVETLDGEQLGRRELLHAHSTAPFTRSETIEIPDGTACVVVRGHDQTHGYGGQAMIVNVDTCATHAVQAGAGTGSVPVTECPESTDS